MHQTVPAPLKFDRRLQTRNAVLVLGLRVRNHRVLARRDLFRQIHVLRQRRLAFLDRTLEIDVLDRVAEVGGLLDDGDEAVLDLEVDLAAFGHVLAEGAGCCDCKFLAAVEKVLLVYVGEWGGVACLV